ncbi:Sporulation-specific protein 6 [Vanrija pseudolonga]|uniref:Sporulation-specific protein 6 n=1 Tax=Vanrija pseudolonga TaxID=143232 RepID=A0AAF1BEP7_9TREE|nr:Sporulation-specific protein 6 [Vanrija pseudolonga]
MTAITRTRTDPLAAHNPAHGPLALQPAVPPPAADVFGSAAPSKAVDKMNSPRKAAPAERFVSSKAALVDGKRAPPAATTAAGEPRAALAGVNLNVGTLQKRLQTAARPHAKSIPQPAAVPDVFDTEPPRTGAAAASALGKRPRERSAPATSSKRARAEAAALAAKSHKHEQEQWLAKWQKVFPTLVFHFEIGAEEGVVGRNLNNRVQQMGARVDQFFSQRVSHLVVKGGASPHKPRAAPSQSKRVAREAADTNPFLDSTGVTDLVQKAEKLGIKVWTVKKLTDMLDQLAPVGNAAGDSLSHLLADEKIHGTRERDFSAPRPDFYYFKPGSKFLLIEDATGRNRPVMVKEYNSKDHKEWPCVHEHFLRLTSSSCLPTSARSDNIVKDLRERALSLYVDRVPFRGEEPPQPALKRSQSLRDLSLTSSLPEAEPYLKASGNSVVITSAIASTSTANTTPGTFVGGVPQLGANKDRAIMQMSKRVQVLKGNARLAASSKKLAGGVENRDPNEAGPSTLRRRKSTGMDAPTPPVKEFLSQNQVVAMLKQLKAPTTMAKPSYDERVRNRELVDTGYKRKDQDTASGYCENCRVRYQDLSLHVASKKHRRFATNPKNFVDLDDMLQCLQRPPNPAICYEVDVCRPCYKLHDKDKPCGRCMDDPEVYSSPPPSSRGSSVHGSAQKPRYDVEPMDEDEEEDDDEEEEQDEQDFENEESNMDEGAEAADGWVEPTTIQPLAVAAAGA